ncbi:MAG: hypothetical protein ACRDTR_11585 [Rubrobacter sp.]
MIEYKVYRLEDDGTTTEISTHGSIVEGTTAASHIVESVDHDYSYQLHTSNGCVASFADGRVGYREWMMRTGRISPSLEDKYDHDEDEVMQSAHHMV